MRGSLRKPAALSVELDLGLHLGCRGAARTEAAGSTGGRLLRHGHCSGPAFPGGKPSLTAMPLRASSHPGTRLASAGARGPSILASIWGNHEGPSQVQAPIPSSAKASGTTASQLHPSLQHSSGSAPLRKLLPAIQFPIFGPVSEDLDLRQALSLNSVR